MFDRIHQRLQRQTQQQRQRERLVLNAPPSGLTRIGHKELVNFSSNDYLGFAQHPAVVHALEVGAKRWGVGAGASHLVSGHSQIHEDLEQALAALTQRPRALLFSNGYMANLALISTLMEKDDTVLHDRLNHASLFDGTLLAGCRFLRYQHLDMTSLKQRLARAQGHCLIVTDGVFSMDGDTAPLRDLVQISRTHEAMLMVDDAHGIGVLGPHGAGLLEQEQLSVNEVPILMGTLGKALGTAGAFVAGSETLIEYLIQFARPYIYTTASSPAMAYATLTALELLEKEAWRRTHLKDLIHHFQSTATELGLTIQPSQTPIQPVVIGDNTTTLRVARALREHGFLVGAIRPPTVPEHTARLRITLCADHRPEHIIALLQTLSRLHTS
ncbi:8-amino-7-oxononanoate synthase [Paenalcaligenes hominis]|uniref:8-amino-7-oxononanoate synthase n=1 Tax=Paenalcaligenes hominis TaxID=643674 RepID=A0ABX0WSU6_9BURK|nr:8-amino-7-oxononanoate synthase [Paenalcaligenes hominis]NJB65845.1 8-amino-7-oxononanoate synthase [Paenalcaligenes hominis]GGE70169.1 8-amino-7-oxononanoate synthase [Paenalcaligenes hominis]